jgi:hypothetical protein
MLYWMAMEPLMGFGEITYFKRNSRFIALFILVITCFITKSNSFANVLRYLFGYVFVSVCVQHYSLQQIEILRKQKEQKEQKKQIKIKIKIKNKDFKIKNKNKN